MTLALHVATEQWRAHAAAVVAGVAATGPDAAAVAVVKGNGYGFGQLLLASRARQLAPGPIAVGTVAEAAELLAAEPDIDVVILEPVDHQDITALPADRTVCTVASVTGLLAAAERGGRIVVEGLTSTHRFGMDEAELAEGLARRPVAAALAAGRLTIDGLALHLPIAQPTGPRRPTATTRRELDPDSWQAATPRAREAMAWGWWWTQVLDRLGLPEPARRRANVVWLSHLADSELAAVGQALPAAALRARLGTRLWLQDKESLRVSATVAAVHPVDSVETVGYRQRPGPRGATLVVVSGGTRHGVGLAAPAAARSWRQRATAAGSGALQATGRAMSPFRWQGRRLWYAEPPHLSVSLLWVPRGVVVPAVGDELDCTVRFTTTTFDAVVWE